MSAIFGTYIDGKVVLDAPAPLPDGTRVRLVTEDSEYVGVGMRDEDWPTTPEGIAALIARMDATEPVQMTDEEMAAWEKSRADYKVWWATQQDAYHEKIGKLFE